MPFGYQTFYHLNSELLVCYLKHGLNNRPFEQQFVLDHLNTKVVHYSDPQCNYVFKYFFIRKLILQKKNIKDPNSGLVWYLNGPNVSDCGKIPAIHITI